MKYELWRSARENSDSFFAADNQGAREMLPPDARLIRVIGAASWNEAQQKRYDFMGWGNYQSPDQAQ